MRAPSGRWSKMASSPTTWICSRAVRTSSWAWACTSWRWRPAKTRRQQRRAAQHHARGDLGSNKVFAQLGFNNVVRALRVRFADGKRQALDYEALLAEKQALEQRLKALSPTEKR